MMTLNTETFEVAFFITCNLHEARRQPTVYWEGQSLHFTPMCGAALTSYYQEEKATPFLALD